MGRQAERRYRISEVSDMLQLGPHVLRQWEEQFPQLRPRRDRANRRYYLAEDIEIARRIKQLVRHEKMTLKGAARVLSQELHGEGRPKTQREALEVVDRLERQVRALLGRMDETDRQIRELGR